MQPNGQQPIPNQMPGNLPPAQGIPQPPAAQPAAGRPFAPQAQPGQPIQPGAAPQAPGQMPQMPGQPGQQTTPGQIQQGFAGPGQTPPAKTNPNSTQNTLQIAEIRDGIVIMNDGSYRAVVLARSINFDLMSAQEREAVEFAYQNFLNSLYFNIQISIRSRKVDMRPYLEKLEKVRSENDNMLLALLMEDYIYYITQLVEQTNIMNKQFYIVIPYFKEVGGKQVLGETGGLFSNLLGGDKNKQHLVINEADLTKAKTELQNRVQSVVNGLMQLGVQAVPLDTQELIELYYDVYNPDTATRQPLTNFHDLGAVVISKGEGQAKQPHLDGGAE